MSKWVLNSVHVKRGFWRLTDRQTNRKKDRQTMANRKGGGGGGVSKNTTPEINSKKTKATNKQTNRQTDRQTDRHKETNNTAQK